MASETFARFIAQLRAQGREKGDGFDRSHFEGLTADERPEVERILQDALLRGDSTAVGGLLLLDPRGAPDTLQDALRRMPFENGARVTIVGALLSLAPDAALQRELVRYLDYRTAATRRQALNYLTRTAPNPEFAPALQAYVHSESDDGNRALGAELLLYWSGAIPSLNESYRRYGATLEALEEGGAADRRRALDALDRAAAEAARG